jgi:hypothetical protein
MKAAGKAGNDPRMLFSWYSGDYCTDPAFADLAPEERANPSMGTWPEGRGYLEQQRRRLPTHKYRRLHLNLPGAPDGAFLDGDVVMRAIIPDLRKVPRELGKRYVAGVDMSGGSLDDACLAVAHREGSRRCLDLLIAQDGQPPFNPRDAVRKFVRALREYGLSEVWGDAYAGQTFRRDFEDAGITYRVSELSRTELYEELEPPLNAGEVELLDIPKLRDQLLTLVIRGSRVDHQHGDHDDWSNAAALGLERAYATTDGTMVTAKPRWYGPRPKPVFADPLERYRINGGGGFPDMTHRSHSPNGELRRQR